MQKVHQQETHRQQQPHGGSSPNIPKMLEDVLAGNIQSQQDQFADLHNRIQIINHQVDSIYDLLEKMHNENEHRFEELMKRVVPADDRAAAALRNIEKVDRTTMNIFRDLESKDFKDMMQQMHRAIENSQEGLSRSLPEAMGAGMSYHSLCRLGRVASANIQAVVSSHRPSLISFLLIAIAVQIMVTGAYIMYKKRRGGAPKKYL